MTGSGTFLDQDFTATPNSGWTKKKLVTTFGGSATAGTPIGTRTDGYLDPSHHPPVGVPSSKLMPDVHLLSLPNGAFENGAEGWGIGLVGAGQATIDASTSLTGANSFLLGAPNNGDSATITCSYVPCTEGIQYYVATRAKLKSGNAILYLQVVFFDGAKTYTGNQSLQGYVTGTALNTSGFTQLGYSFIPPAGTRYFYVSVIASATSASNTGALWIDEVRVNRAPVVGEIVGAAASGANADITSLSTLITARLNVTGSLLTSSPGSDYAPAYLSMLNEGIQGSTGIFGVGVMHLEHSYSGGKGARNTLYVNTTLAGPSASGTDNQDYVAGYFRASAMTADQGTASAPRGGLFGTNPVAALNANATNFLDVTGEEINVAMYAGSSSIYRAGLRIASFGTAKATLDMAMQVNVLANTGFGYGLVFSSIAGQATPVTGTLIAGVTDSPTALTAQAGIDFSAYTFSGVAGGYAARLTSTMGVLIDGTINAPAGNIGILRPQVVNINNTTNPQLMLTSQNNATDKKLWLQTVDSSGNFFLQTLNDAQSTAVTAIGVARGSGNNIASINIGASLTPGGDNIYSLGSASNRFSQVYASSGAINTSDENEKDEIADLSSALLDAVDEVGVLQYKFKDAIADKGADKARIHIGITAQRLEAALKANGIDPAAYSFWCRDPVFEDIEEDVEVDTPVMQDEDYEAEETTVVDGVARRATVKKTRSVPVVDRFPVVDGATGEPVTTPGIPATPKIVPVEVTALDADGKPVVSADGTPVTHMVKRQAVDEAGELVFNSAIAQQPVYHEVPRTTKTTVKQTVRKPKLDDKGEPVYLHGVRYDGVILAMLAALRRRVGTAKAS